MNRGAPISSRKMFALVATLASLVAFGAPAIELGYWRLHSDHALSTTTPGLVQRLRPVRLTIRMPVRAFNPSAWLR